MTIGIVFVTMGIVCIIPNRLMCAICVSVSDQAITQLTSHICKWGNVQADTIGGGGGGALSNVYCSSQQL